MSLNSAALSEVLKMLLQCIIAHLYPKNDMGMKCFHFIHVFVFSPFPQLKCDEKGNIVSLYEFEAHQQIARFYLTRVKELCDFAVF